MKINALVRTLIVGAALSAGNLFANAVKLGQTDNDGDLPGGEFIATISADNSFDTIADNRTFLTFCLERFINVGFGDKGYTYTIDNASKYNYTSTPIIDPLSAGSAWLYEKFFKGTLAAPNGSGTYFDANRDFNAGVLQKAFWDLENEVADAGNLYVAMAITHFGGDVAATYGAAGAGSKVKVLNIWTTPTLDNPLGDVQSQLIYVPDGGLTVALLGLGLLSLAAIRRKL